MRRVTTLETIEETIEKLGSHLECQEGKESEREREGGGNEMRKRMRRFFANESARKIFVD